MDRIRKPDVNRQDNTLALALFIAPDTDPGLNPSPDPSPNPNLVVTLSSILNPDHDLN